ncbi:efflux RND transporter periplasmic adaptor subunit [Xanthomonas rydalmerensis]|uniref:Efflux RND transporter periplasmic adaptor subunit n=1 Tax=Xanthomonas rydalmerensis TaxID=3046274 RepID=A0ABZ0JLQ3_9XANT|nr:efflux RND transporter periplasmic adaptor subunit [Xanthomonas sp. DM-2023]WOS40720.1 efflux RND transporter periplasmic adaptor subunit [Xanthomonas sp. DM-2023]WOS44904.1 efflux RND transporter periplasmic adaptor subunit [Xanthomonas sp. DM-2023]WOS49084.1 efflux RND transporter periplasmic adaptor subunit [Xanthomonas sp. DM-2023]WOS53264.1 efflux RND transporter periplasmic adaptor subunit [Xanthomonas sp. DM-2023]WOS57447.1 efflux RND transporter periplasmic adaptor subunit [Xanthomo
MSSVARRFSISSSRWLLLAVVATVVAACSSKPPPQMPQTQVGVQTVKVQRLAVDQTLSGRTVAYMSSDVRPQVGGILRKRLFAEGQDVHAGQVLYEIDPATYQAAYDTAKGDLAQAEAAVLSARPKAQRYQTLVGLDAVSKQDGDDAVATLRANEAAVVAAKAALQTARINLDYTRITAPISGRIGTSSYTPGALVSAGQSEVLATINQLDPMYVDVTQSSAQLLQLRRQLDAGQLKAVDGKAEVTLQLEDGSTYARGGTLEVVDAAVDTATGTVKLRAVVPNPDRLLLPGMYVKAMLSMAVDEQAILVPQQAISRNSKGEAVAMVVGRDNKVAQRVLTTGDAIGDKWVVRDGLKAGDRVVVQGLQKVSVGAEVKAVEVTETATAGSSATTAKVATQGAAAAPKAD